MGAEDIEIRPFRAGDFHAVATLACQTLGDDAPSADRLARDFLLDPGFEPDDLLIAERGRQPVGFLLAPRLRPPALADHEAQYRTGWIAAFGVDPEFRRQGIATALLHRAVEIAARDGLQRIDVADFPVRYLVPGIDPAARAAAHALLVDKFGFEARDSVASMGIDLATLPDRLSDDASIRRLDPGEIPQIRDLLWTGLGWGWWHHMARNMEARFAGANVPTDILVAWQAGAPVGVAHYCGKRFGPLAVAESMRGQGLGTRLTWAALNAMRDHGVDRAYFLIAEAQVERFYARLGFSVLRRFTRLRLPLAG